MAPLAGEPGATASSRRTTCRTIRAPSSGQARFSDSGACMGAVGMVLRNHGEPLNLPH